MMLEVVKRAVGKDDMIGNIQILLNLHPSVLSDLKYSKLHPLPLLSFKFLKSKKRAVIVIEAMRRPWVYFKHG